MKTFLMQTYIYACTVSYRFGMLVCGMMFRGFCTWTLRTDINGDDNRYVVQWCHIHAQLMKYMLIYQAWRTCRHSLKRVGLRQRYKDYLVKNPSLFGNDSRKVWITRWRTNLQIGAWGNHESAAVIGKFQTRGMAYSWDDSLFDDSGNCFSNQNWKCRFNVSRAQNGRLEVLNCPP